MGKLAREKLEFRNVWTVDGRICYIGEGFHFVKLTTMKMFLVW